MSKPPERFEPKFPGDRPGRPSVDALATREMLREFKRIRHPKPKPRAPGPTVLPIEASAEEGGVR